MMNIHRSLTALSIITLIFLLNSNAYSRIERGSKLWVGKNAYQRAFGRGCGSYHDISSNPQLVELISDGLLDKNEFSEVIVNGRNGCPKSADAIMDVNAVEDSGYTLEQAIDAVYSYLQYLGDGTIPSDDPVPNLSCRATYYNGVAHFPCVDIQNAAGETLETYDVYMNLVPGSNPLSFELESVEHK